MTEQQENKCYGNISIFIMAQYLIGHWFWFAIDAIHMGAWKTGFSALYVNALTMAPAEWQLHLRSFGVDSWLLWPPVDGGCEWIFAVRPKQSTYARYLVREADAGRQPKRRWGNKKARHTILG